MIKSNNPHLAGGEIRFDLFSILFGGLLLYYKLQTLVNEVVLHRFSELYVRWIFFQTTAKQDKMNLRSQVLGDGLRKLRKLRGASA